MEKKRMCVFKRHFNRKKMSFFQRIIVLSLMIMTLTFPVHALSQIRKVTLNIENATLAEIINQVRSETSYRFLYRVEEVSKYGKRSIHLQNASIEEFLNTLLSDTGLTYNMEDEVIIISPRQEKANPQIARKTVTGKVVDEHGFPLPGVTVLIRGTHIGTSTNDKGVFSLEVPATDSLVLVASFIGKKSQEININTTKDEDVTIVLEEDVSQIGEIVVTGYSNIRKESFTGSSVHIKGEELQKISRTSIIKALQVFDPSFRIQENNRSGSDPNAVPEMYIRGRSGVGVKELEKEDLSRSALENNPNLPLFIMDGFEVSIQKVYDFDPNRIESIHILKDAAATAMYGSRAGNGVVVITTVVPKPGELNISYNLSGLLSMPDLSDYNLMNASEKLEAEVAAGIYTADAPMDQLDRESEYYAKLSNIIEGVDTYWLSKPLRTVFNHKHSLYIEGGHHDLRYGVNVLYYNENGVMKESLRDRVGAGIYLDYRVRNFQIRNETNFYVTKEKESPYGSFSQYTLKLPYDKFKDEEGNYLKTTTTWNRSHTTLDRGNPLWEAHLGSYDRTRSDEIENKLGLNWYITPHLQAKGSFRLAKSTSHRKNFLDPQSTKNTNALSLTNLTSGELSMRDGENINWDLTVSLAYNRSINDHNINFNAGLNAQSGNQKSTSVMYRGFPSGHLSSPNYAEEVYQKPTVSEKNSRLIGFLGILNYSYKNTYLLDASIRADGSSEFGTEKKWSPFWSVGTGLNLHYYDFIRNNEWIDLLKVKVTYGSTGKVNYPPYAAQTIYQIQNDEWYKTGYGAEVIALGNKNLKWEKKYTTNFGLDFEIFQGKLQFRGEYYVETTKDLINDVTIPSSTGFTTYKDNMGEVEGKGYSIDLRSTIVNQRDWFVSVFFNLAHDKRKISKLSESLKAYNDQVVNHYETESPITGDITTPFIQYKEGGTLTPIYGMRSYGIDPSNGKEMLVKTNGDITYEWMASEQVVLGDTEPKARGSFGLNLRYKNWTLFSSFLYQFGGDFYNSTLVDKVEDANIYNYNADKRVLTDRWQKPGDRAKYRALQDLDGGIRKTRPTERFVQKYNYVSMNSLTLGYEFNPEKIRRAGLGMLRLEIGTNDLFRISTVKAERGLDYPFARTMDVSLHLTF